MERAAFDAALVAVRSGDRPTAYRLAREALLTDPNDISAWLVMSQSVESLHQQRECIERALTIDPASPAALQALEDLRVKEIVAGSFAPALTQNILPDEILGYLHDHDVVTAEQAITATDTFHDRRAQGDASATMADVLVELGYLSAAALAHAMIEQQLQRMRPGTGYRISLLGEYLLDERLLTPAQLEAALAQQIELRLSGQRVPLGRLLIQQHLIRLGDLQRVLQRQRDDVLPVFM